MTIDGESFEIATDFRVALDYAAAAKEGNLTEETFFRLWFPARRPTDLQAALDAIGLFFRCGEAARAEPSGPQPYDLIEDAPAIFAAFYKHYGVNLAEVRLHWWQFCALLDGLLTHSLRQRVWYRTTSLDGMDARERAEVLKFRSRYALEPGESLQDHLRALDEIASRHKPHNESENQEVTKST